MTHAFPLPPRNARTLAMLVVALVVLVVVSLGMGAVHVPPSQVLNALLGQDVPDPGSALLQLRVPRVLGAMLVGACLGGAGVVLQSVMGNPLLEPGLLGVSGGASVGAVLALWAEGQGWMAGVPSAVVPWLLPLAAFGGALLATAVVVTVGRAAASMDPTFTLLTGVAVNVACGALVALFVFSSTDAQLRTVAFWSLGSMAGLTWTGVLAALPWWLVLLAVVVVVPGTLNALALGPAHARSLGVNVRTATAALLVVVALAVGASVALCGVVSFVGLVVPHVVRLWGGADHRFTAPASALGGAFLTLLADTAARTLWLPSELPLGVLTSLLGAPVFVSLLLQAQRRGVLA